MTGDWPFTGYHQLIGPIDTGWSSGTTTTTATFPYCISCANIEKKLDALIDKLSALTKDEWFEKFKLGVAELG